MKERTATKHWIERHKVEIVTTRADQVDDPRMSARFGCIITRNHPIRRRVLLIPYTKGKDGVGHQRVFSGYRPHEEHQNPRKLYGKPVPATLKQIEPHLPAKPVWTRPGLYHTECPTPTDSEVLAAICMDWSMLESAPTLREYVDEFGYEGAHPGDVAENFAEHQRQVRQTLELFTPAMLEDLQTCLDVDGEL